jgi:hypothetical protein
MLKAAKAWDSEELRVLLAGVTLLCSRVKLCMLMFGLGAINPKVGVGLGLEWEVYCLGKESI